MIAKKEGKEAAKENPFKPAKGPSPNHPRPRIGKTAKDRAKRSRSI